jgi:ribonuclease-3
LKEFFHKLIQFITQKNEDVYKEPGIDAKLDTFQKKIKYKFNHPKLLLAALTHNSYFYTNGTEHTEQSPYERMEFLGDAVLGLVVTEFLFSLYPDKDEGFLSKLKSNIVSEKYLAVKSIDFELGTYVMISEKEIRNGGRERKSILSNTVEALICAIYLDSGLEEARKFITTFIIDGFQEQVLVNSFVNFKSILQEYTQAKYQLTPEYKLISETGPDHLKTFKMKVFVNEKECGSGEGPNKKEAHQRAAEDACKNLKLS